MRAFAQALSLGMGKEVVVVLGDKDVTKFRYYRQRPHMEFLRVLAEVTNLIVVGEYFTSKKAHCCVQRKPDGGQVKIVRRQAVCVRCTEHGSIS